MEGSGDLCWHACDVGGKYVDLLYVLCIFFLSFLLNFYGCRFPKFKSIRL